VENRKEINDFVWSTLGDISSTYIKEIKVCLEEIDNAFSIFKIVYFKEHFTLFSVLYSLLGHF
jgi:hypothetical protein